LRDEIYIQVIKQTISNPRLQSTKKGYELLAMFLASFPPSESFEPYLRNHLNTKKADPNELVSMAAQDCLYRLKRELPTSTSGGNSSVLSDAELNEVIRLLWIRSPFRSTLVSLMERQRQNAKLKELQVPFIAKSLADAIINCTKPPGQGLFRISVRVTELQKLREKLEQDPEYIIPTDTSAHLAGGLFKEWLRSLEEPVIPTESYYDFIDQPLDVSNLRQCVAKLPESHRNLLYFVLSLLDHCSTHEDTGLDSHGLAIIFSPNFFRCPEKDLQRIAKLSVEETKAAHTMLLTFKDEYQCFTHVPNSPKT